VYESDRSLDVLRRVSWDGALLGRRSSLPTNDLSRAVPASVRRGSIATVSPSSHQRSDKPAFMLPPSAEAMASMHDQPSMQPHFKVKRRLVVTIEAVRDLRAPLVDASSCMLSTSLCVTSARIGPEVHGSVGQHIAIASRVASLPLEARLLLQVSSDNDNDHQLSGWFTFALFDHRDCLRLGRHVLHAWNEPVPSRCLNTSSNVAAFAQTLQVTLNVSIGNDDVAKPRTRATQWQRQCFNPPDTIPPTIGQVSETLLKVGVCCVLCTS
jgi:hypothetical protein